VVGELDDGILTEKGEVGEVKSGKKKTRMIRYANNRRRIWK
jgi:hypothetical protein